jgi:hypothetical protein
MQQCIRRQRHLTIEHRHLIEHNPRIVRKLRARGLSAFLGSVDHSVLLDRASVAEARTLSPALKILVISTGDGSTSVGAPLAWIAL